MLSLPYLFLYSCSALDHGLLGVFNPVGLSCDTLEFFTFTKSRQCCNIPNDFVLFIFTHLTTAISCKTSTTLHFTKANLMQNLKEIYVFKANHSTIKYSIEYRNVKMSVSHAFIKKKY